MYFVYELVDPRTDVTGYIGITNNPNQRYNDHVKGREGKGKKYDWIQRLQEEQTQPKMKILEIVDNVKQARKQERCWIQHHISKGFDIKNTITYKKGQEPNEEDNAAKEHEINEENNVILVDDYYTRSQVKEILGIDTISFVTLIGNGLITNVFPDRRSQFGYYLKSDIDNLAANLETFREKHAGELVPQTIFRKRER